MSSPMALQGQDGLFGGYWQIHAAVCYPSSAFDGCEVDLACAIVTDAEVVCDAVEGPSIGTHIEDETAAILDFVSGHAAVPHPLSLSAGSLPSGQRRPPAL